MLYDKTAYLYSVFSIDHFIYVTHLPSSCIRTAKNPTTKLNHLLKIWNLICKNIVSFNSLLLLAQPSISKKAIAKPLVYPTPLIEADPLDTI